MIWKTLHSLGGTENTEFRALCCKQSTSCPGFCILYNNFCEKYWPRKRMKAPLPILSLEVERAWFAYQSMAESKRMYFAYLQELDQKYDKNEAPSIAENLRLEKLLKTHDEKVSGFNDAMKKVEEPAARKVLMTRITEAIAAH